MVTKSSPGDLTPAFAVWSEQRAQSSMVISKSEIQNSNKLLLKLRRLLYAFANIISAKGSEWKRNT